MKLFIPAKNSHKGQNGKLLIIGGSKQYHGAPKFSALSARRFVDLIYFYPGEHEPNLIREMKKVPEVIVIKDDELLAKLHDVDCVLFGVGLGAKAIAHHSIKLEAIVKKSKKLVIDGDGLKRFKPRGRIPGGSIITPHEGEFKMLFGIPGTRTNVRKMAAKHRCVILKKGPIDIIADGREARQQKLETNTAHNQGMTKGGTGDVLSGLVAALACKNDSFIAAVSGSRICGAAGNRLKKKFGFNYSASDLADELAHALRTIRQAI